jgi:hypothetical protein
MAHKDNIIGLTTQTHLIVVLIDSFYEFYWVKIKKAGFELRDKKFELLAIFSVLIDE